MSKTIPSRWTEEQVKELMLAGKLPKGPERVAAFDEIASKTGKNFKTVTQKFFVTRKEIEDKKKVKSSKKKERKPAEKTVGQKSYETRLRNKELGIAPKRYKKRKYHNPPTEEKKLGVTRNELRFPYKKISIEGGEVVVSF